ncbi:Aldo/keto reductase [Lophiostoma macrostomum CBS 122681]|uniref:Aldo/keto reductase n=1 Tax=Lophiostoma macrostomum CBS 122681 TaxID=1314788 RepID=A0A6A6SNR6_9PLEO|nr:Aldo/keto reductase [Lophiostoma macrostomum CBS 122681]
MLRNPVPKSPLGNYRILSPSAGVRVSPLCLGTMNFGNAWKSMMGVECTKDTAFEILDHYYEMGGNFVDTANAYHGGESEQWLGEWMQKNGNRDEIVLATKYSFGSPVPSAKHRINYAGNHKKSLVYSLEASLGRLQTSYVDILYVHWFDYTTSIPEMMQALNRLINDGKVHYLGISDAPAWVAMKANMYAQQLGLAQFVIYQGRYSCADRDCEREILPVCEDTGMAFAPYGVQGGGLFKTKQQKESEKHEGRNLPIKYDLEKHELATQRLEEVAEKEGAKVTQVALAYAYQKAPYIFSIVGCRKLEYLTDAIDALTLKLSDDDYDKIDRATGFEPGFPLSMTFQHYDTTVNYKPCMTAQDSPLGQLSGRLDIVSKPKPLPPHAKAEYIQEA